MSPNDRTNSRARASCPARPPHTARLAPLLVTPILMAALLVCAGCETTGNGISFIGKSSDEELWAIRCITLHGSDRFRLSKMYAEALKKVPGLKPDLVQVISDEDGTGLFYGRYRRIYGAERSGKMYKPNHLRDLETVRTLRFQGAEVWPFILASMDVLPTYRSHHPEWNLANVDGYWSLHVAVFYNTDAMRSRQSAAEEYCGLLRKDGVDAYFHHGPVNSSVYVGTYPREAVTEVRREAPLRGEVVTTNTIVDPRFLEAQKRFPISLHNGHKMYEVIRNRRTGEVKNRIPAPSFPVIIPKAQRQTDAFERP